jgi:hypothetical protein
MRSTTHPSRPNAIVDPDSVTRNQGRQIDFSKASIRYQQGAVRINLTGAAARGATSLAVDALTSDLPVDTILNFGNIANVAVVVGVAGAAVDATSVPVAALSGAIPSGTVLDFGGKKFARLTAAAAAGATALTVSALATALVSGDAATYTGGTLSARLTAAAAAGATALTVDELALPVPAASVAYALGEVGSKRIPALTVMAQLASGLCIPRADVTGAETAQFVLETDAQEGSVSDSKSGYGMMTGAHVFENLLPDADPTTGLIPAGWKTELRAFGGAWIFEQYADSR